jgi:hypothetical protein
MKIFINMETPLSQRKRQTLDVNKEHSRLSSNPTTSKNFQDWLAELNEPTLLSDLNTNKDPEYLYHDLFMELTVCQTSHLERKLSGSNITYIPYLLTSNRHNYRRVLVTSTLSLGSKPAPTLLWVFRKIPSFLLSCNQPLFLLAKIIAINLWLFNCLKLTISNSPFYQQKIIAIKFRQLNSLKIPISDTLPIRECSI